MAKRRIKHREGIPQKPKKPKKAQKPAVDIVKLREAVSKTGPGKSVQESPDGSRKKEPVVHLSPPGRKCVCCGAALSVYNTDKLCRPCDSAIQRWRLFPMDRSRHEKEMARHCLRYVREKFSSKNDDGEVAEEEMPSGSWVRAVGRRKR